MSNATKRFLFCKTSQLTIPLFLPERDPKPSLNSLKGEIIQFGILEPLVVRRTTDDQFLVLGGRQRLMAVWELQDEGYEKEFRHLPCYTVESDSHVKDMKIFLLLNNHAPLGVGEIERVVAFIESASVQPTKKTLVQAR